MNSSVMFSAYAASMYATGSVSAEPESPAMTSYARSVRAPRADLVMCPTSVLLLAARQPHGFAARCHQRVRPPPHQRVHLRCARLADGIAEAVGAESPPVEHDEDEWTEPAHRHALVNPGDLRRPARAPRPPSRSRRTRLRGDSRRRRAHRRGPVVRRAPPRSPP